MLRAIQGSRAFPHDPSMRGYQLVYRPGEVNQCPGCGRSHWLVGRVSAECGFCATALALADTGMTGVGTMYRPHAKPDRFPDAEFDVAA
ncbi:hypothetical protein [Sphingosinicella sp. BN140058]|uniref:hypothetical protein n=1 Tax=Sphingosinicella sp. BN140058 TaxID=1892855 RepID=UPI00101168E3|nr:hypothetical protein [Sphingosinicella sp. BN140058]QAY79254.1 hypothetical protein ETR14_23960 [Sphingosinicella sp. BN140058]